MNIDLSGKKFFKLTVVRQLDDGGGCWGKIKWLCVCDCGNETVVLMQRLKYGRTKSCGCLRSERNSQRKGVPITHGHNIDGIRTKYYRTWCGMKARCLNKTNKDYYIYGGRGISIDTSWVNSFETFYNDMSQDDINGLQLDRINPNGPYNKQNCRWVTPKVNAQNRRRDLHSTIKKICNHKNRQDDFLFCPYCGIEFAANDVDPMQMNGQVANGGGAPTSPEGVNHDGSKAGVVL